MIYIKEGKPTKVPGLSSLYVKFDYNQVLVNYMQNMKVRYYNKKTFEWECPISELSNIVNEFYRLGVRLTLQKQEKIEAQKIPKNYKFKIKPFGHQVEGIEYGLNHKNYILGDDQGLGKTKQMIDLSQILKKRDKIKHCLIVCCVNTLKTTWFNEIIKHSDDAGYVLGTRKHKNGSLYIGSIKDRLDDTKRRISEFYIITNVETLRNKEIVKNLVDGKNRIDMLIVDEIHKCSASTTSEQSKGLLGLAKIERKIALSGTILKNRPTEAYLPLKLLGYEKSNLTAFKNFYCNFGGFGGFSVISYKNLNVLQDTLDKYMLRRLKEQVIDLPPKIYSTEYVEMSERQKMIYKEVLSELKNNIDLIKTSPSPLAQLIRLRQATGYTGILSSTVKESAKLDRLADYLENIVAENHKAIVVSNWTSITDEVVRRFSKYNPAVITGQVEDRQSQIDKFQNDPNCKICVGTIGAMGTGLTLTAANYVLFLDEPWNKADKVQAEDRAHRIGTTGTVNIVTFITKDTVDELVNNLVNDKAIITDYLIDKVDNDKLKEMIIDFVEQS